MVPTRRIGWSVLVWSLGAAAFGQQPAPLADRLDQPLLPYGISELGVNLSGELAFFFKDPDGTEALHVIGDFVMTLGKEEGQALRSREAVVWIVHRDYQGRPYRHLQILLWRDAEVAEVGHTVTSGPALFVTVNSFGEISINVDDVAFESSTENPIYREGNAIRQAFGTDVFREQDKNVSLRVFDASGLGPEEKKARRRPPILLQFPGEVVTREVNGQQVITVIGGAYLSRGDSTTGEFLEIRADSIAVFLHSSERTPLPETAGEPGLGGALRGDAKDEDPRGESRARRQRRPDPDRQRLSAGFGDVEVESVYLEGDVIMSQGASMIRASRLFYDFRDEKALMLDAVIRTTLVERNVPLYVRAEEIRQLAANEFAASNAILTTSEFHSPHYHVGASRVELIDRTPPDSTQRRGGIRSGSFRIRDATLNLAGHPVGYWPYIQGRVDTSETAIKSLRTGYSDDFGVELETEWHLFNVLGLETPEGFESSLSLDFFSNRGPAIGVDADYQRDRYFGLLKSYLLTDNDEDFLGRERETPSPKDVRGRFLLRHRQYLEDDWRLSLELSYISDRGFLEEFFEDEFDNDKDQETLLYLKKQADNWAFTAHLQTRLMDFYTQTERLPDLGYLIIGEPLGDWATWFSENRVGIVRYRPKDQTFPELLRNGRVLGSGSVARVDSRQEIDLPLDLGPVRMIPFVSLRGTAWDDSPAEGGLARGLGTVGMRGSLSLTRVYPNARSSLFAVDGIRHIIKPDVTAWLSGVNKGSDDLFNFDETVEGVDGVDGVALGLRQQWQTKRGRGETRRIVDFLTLDIEVGLFNDSDGNVITNGYASFSRPENSLARNYINSSFIWRLNDRTALLSELNYDLNDGEIDILNVSLAVERSPRLSYLLGYRYIEESDSNLLGFDLNYRLTEKHSMAIREAFDFDRGRALDFTVAFIRKFPRWFGAVAFELDEAEDDFGVSFSIWPEGLPQATLGSRRFTGLATSTRIQRN